MKPCGIRLLALFAFVVDFGIFFYGFHFALASNSVFMIRKGKFIFIKVHDMYDINFIVRCYRLKGIRKCDIINWKMTYGHRSTVWSVEKKRISLNG